MIKKIQATILSTFALLGLVAMPVLSPATVNAANRAEVCNGISSIGGGNACNNDDDKNKLSNFIKDIINILLFIIGAIAVLMIIIGGLRYVLSGGDQNAVTGAKNTILYSVVGLIVAIMAFAIVNFVVGTIK